MEVKEEGRKDGRGGKDIGLSSASHALTGWLSFYIFHRVYFPVTRTDGAPGEWQATWFFFSFFLHTFFPLKQSYPEPERRRRRGGESRK